MHPPCLFPEQLKPLETAEPVSVKEEPCHRNPVFLFIVDNIFQNRSMVLCVLGILWGEKIDGSVSGNGWEMTGFNQQKWWSRGEQNWYMN